MDKLLIIDGHNLLFQMFYGMPNHFYGKNDKPIWATFGFVGALSKMIGMVNPTHLLVVFDGEVLNERSLLLEEYKSNRKDFNNVSIDENPFIQLADIYKCLDYLNINYYETTSVETDDIIAGYVNKYKDIEIIIASNDTDFYQLIDENVSILKYKGKNSVILKEEDIFARFGVYPYQYADFKSLVGDSADCIKGIPLIGVKTASKLLLEYNSIDCILENLDSIKNEKIRTNIINFKERLLVNYKLIYLDYNGILPYDFNELLYKKYSISSKELLKILDIL